MAETDCRPQVNACAVRVARLDTNGVPLPGANNMYVSDAFVRVSWASVYTDGEEIEEKNACGITVVSYRGRDTFKRGDIELELVTADPYLSEMLSGGDLLTSGSLPKGFAAPPIGPVEGNGVSIEVWAIRVDDGDQDADYPYAHWVYPKIVNLRLGDHEHANAANKPVFTGQAYENPNWFDGPVGDWPALSDRAYQWLPTNVIPTPSCAYQTLAAS